MAGSSGSGGTSGGGVSGAHVAPSSTTGGMAASGGSSPQAESSGGASSAFATGGATAVPPDPICGDGKVMGLEECDDGNQRNDDECTNQCRRAACLDGFVQAGVEACDDGNRDDRDDCTNACKLAVCGDGILHAGREECDDANTRDDDACVGDCRQATCGDGFLWADKEQCDAGTGEDGFGCTADCRPTPVELALGDYHTCTRFSDGRVQCWGDNSRFQLGVETPASVGTQASELLGNLHTVVDDATAIAARGYHTCALRQSGKVVCWGDNSFGQLGYALPLTNFRAVEVTLSGPATAICASEGSGYALLGDGTVSGWGYDYRDTVIDAHTAPFSEPVAKLACGKQMLCALLASGAIECWGQGPEAAAPDEPMRINLEPLARPWEELVAGYDFACVRSSGSVRCWGNGSYGQFLDGGGYTRRGDAVNSWVAARTGQLSATQLAASGSVVCAIGRTGDEGQGAKCWGFDARSGALGQPELTAGTRRDLGDDLDEVGTYLPLIDLGSGLEPQVIATSTYHTCAIFTDGRMKCWGYNELGQLGVGRDDWALGDEIGEMGDALPFVLVE
ncbi:MAG: DUF4215 domain-containing protein [Myxococcota bacterium]|nr:DUF4215 domain-containing protein [Myxococcota bacterium]